MLACRRLSEPLLSPPLSQFAYSRKLTADNEYVHRLAEFFRLGKRWCQTNVRILWVVPIGKSGSGRGEFDTRTGGKRDDVGGEIW